MNENESTTDTESPMAAAERERYERRQAEIAAKKAELDKAAADLELESAELKRKANAPRDPHTLAMKARDAIMEKLSHEVSTDPAGAPTRAAWEAIADFFDAITAGASS